MIQITLPHKKAHLQLTWKLSFQRHRQWLAPPPELLQRLRELEEEQLSMPNAAPMDMEEERIKAKKQQCFIGASVALGLVTIATALGAALGARGSDDPASSEASPAPSPTPSPTPSPEFQALKSVLESVSLMVALPLKMSPLHSAKRSSGCPQMQI